MERTHFLRHLGFAGQLERLLTGIPAFGAVGDAGTLSFVYEEWQGDRVEIGGLLTLDTSAEVELAGMQLIFGTVAGDELTLPFSITTAALPMRTVLLAVSVGAAMLDRREVAEVLTADDVNDPDELFRRYASDFAAISFTLGPVPVRLSIGSDYLEPGRHIRNSANQTVAVEPDPDAGPVTLVLGRATLTVGSSGIDLDIAGGGPLSLPPLMLAGTGLAIELKALSVKLDEGPLPAALAALGAERGFDERWRGLFAEQITLWNLDRVFPGGPAAEAQAAAGAQVTASALAIDARGLTGSIAWQRTPPVGERLALETAEIGFDRAWYPLTARAAGRIDLDDIAGGIIGYDAALELDPFADRGGRWRLMLGAIGQSPGDAIVEVDSPPPAFTASASAAAAALGDNDLALLLGALAAGDAADVLRWKRAAVTSLSAEGELGPGGFGLQGTLGIDTDIDLLVTDAPVPLRLGAGTIELSYDSGDGFDAGWQLGDGLDLVLPLNVDIGGTVTLERIGLRRRGDGALAIELGVETDGAGDVAIGGLPNVVTLVYHRGPPERFEIELARDGQELTLLVPGVLYAQGSLRRSDTPFPDVGPISWSSTLRAALTAYLVGNGRAARPQDHFDKNFYLFALDLGLLTATREDGMKALVLSGDLSFKPGIPLGTTGTALYGIGLTYAQNAAPSAADGDYTGWFLRSAPRFSTHASKWIPRGDNWGFGAAVALGSQPDDGRSWNVAAGLFLLLPGPVIMITGKGSLFSPPPQLPKGGSGTQVEAPFAAVVSLDLLRDRLAAELTADIEIGAGGTSMLELYIPAKVEASLAPPFDMELSVGRYMPMDARVSGTALGLYEISTYIVVSTRGIEDFPKPGMRLPAFAMAYGGSGGLSAGFSSAIAELKLNVQAGFDLGVSLASPPVMVGQLFIDGNLMARLAVVSINIGLRTELLVVAPHPFELSGTVRIRVGLPWPIPDIKFSGGFRIGQDASWPDDYPYPDGPISDVSLFPRPNGTAQLAPGESFDGVVISADRLVEGVPIDAGILLAFRAPIGNDSPTIGLIETQADDSADPVWEIAATGQTEDGRTQRIGWRHILADIKLKEAGHAVAAKAGWSFKGTAGTTEHSANTASGGQATRNTLALLAPLDTPVERRFGAGVDVLAEVIEGWRPCEIVPNPKDLAVQFTVPDADTLGIERISLRAPAYLAPERWYALQRHALLPGPNAYVRFEPRAPGGNAFFAQHRVLRAMVLTHPARFDFPIDVPIRDTAYVLTLPTAIFARDTDLEKAVEAGAAMQPPGGVLRLRLPASPKTRQVFFAVRQGVTLDIRGPEHDALEPAPVRETVAVSAAEIWQLVRLHVAGGLSDISVSASQSAAVTSGLLGPYGAVLLGAAYYMEHETRRDAVERKRDASIEMITDLAGQSAAWAQGRPEGLLTPNTEYEVEITVHTHHARRIDNADLEVATDFKTFVHRARLRTEDDIRQPFAPRVAAAPWAPDAVLPWTVDTLPGKDGHHYRTDEFVVRFADAVAAGRIGAHQRTLALRLTHESGRSLEESAAAILAEEKKSQSALQDIVADYVTGQACLNAADPIWLSLHHRFDTLLEPGEYVAELHAADAGGQRQSRLLHQWRFKASRWNTLSEHLGAHRLHTAPQPGTAAAAVQSAARTLSGAPSFSADDMLLGELLHADFGYAPFPAAEQPTVMLGVREDGIAWVLLDGPEPLLRDGLRVELVRGAGVLGTLAVVSNVARTRAVLCLGNPTAPGPLALRFTADGRTHMVQADVPVFDELVAVL